MKTGKSPEFAYTKFEHRSSKALDLLKARVEKSGDFVSLPTLHLEDDIESYSKQFKVYCAPGSVEEVWDAYTQDKPQEVWKGPMVNFLFSYSERDQKLYYPDDADMPVFHEGQQFFCLVDILGPRLVVGLKLMRMDEESRELEIAYLRGGMYRGTQVLSFAGKGSYTEITHKSYFRSKSWIMDAVIYPFFHDMTTGEHHRTVKEKLEKQKR